MVDLKKIIATITLIAFLTGPNVGNSKKYNFYMNLKQSTKSNKQSKQIHPTHEVAKYVLENPDKQDEFMGLESFYKTIENPKDSTTYGLEVITENDIAIYLGLKIKRQGSKNPIYLKVEDVGLNGIKAYQESGPDRFSFDESKMSLAKNKSEKERKYAEKIYKKGLTDILNLIN